MVMTAGDKQVRRSFPGWMIVGTLVEQIDQLVCKSKERDPKLCDSVAEKIGKVKSLRTHPARQQRHRSELRASDQAL